MVACADKTLSRTSCAAFFSVPSALSWVSLTTFGTVRRIKSGPPPRKVQPVSSPGPVLMT
jgi:hypothetical protein